MSYFFHTARLSFRTWEERDIVPFSSLNADPQVMEFFPSMLSEQETRQRIEVYTQELTENSYGLWSVEVTATRQFIGFIGLHQATFKSDFTPCVEIGWRLAKAFWNNGYATEGAKACLEYGFNQIGLDTIRSFTAVLNKRSEHVMQKIGMTKAGEFDHPNVAVGHPIRPHVLYEIEKSH